MKQYFMIEHDGETSFSAAIIFEALFSKLKGGTLKVKELKPHSHSISSLEKFNTDGR